MEEIKVDQQESTASGTIEQPIVRRDSDVSSIKSTPYKEAPSSSFLVPDYSDYKKPITLRPGAATATTGSTTSSISQQS